MLYDIKVKSDNSRQTKAIVNHALEIGYPLNMTQMDYLIEARYFILDPNQAMRWCDPEIYNTALNYQEYTFDEFMDYPGYSRCSCGERLPDICTDWTCPVCEKKWSY